MHSYRITPDRLITIDLQDLLWACAYTWEPVGMDFNSVGGDLPLSLGARVLASRGYSPGLFTFADGNVNNFRQGNVIPVSTGLTRFGESKYSQYRGVTYHLSEGKWVAQLIHHGKTALYKRFKTEIEAAIAYNQKCVQLGLYDRVNEICY